MPGSCRFDKQTPTLSADGFHQAASRMLLTSPSSSPLKVHNHVVGCDGKERGVVHSIDPSVSERVGANVNRPHKVVLVDVDDCLLEQLEHGGRSQSLPGLHPTL